MKVKIVSLIFILLIVYSANSQVNLDSLWGVWNDVSAHDSSRAMAIHKIAWDGYMFSQPDSAFYFAQMEYDFGYKRNNKTVMAKALNMQGVSCYVRSDYINAMNYYLRSLEINEEIADKKSIATSLNNIGLIYSRKGYQVKALEYYQQSLKIYEEINDKSRMSGTLNNIGVICVDLGDYDRSMYYFERCLSIADELSDRKKIAVSLNNLGLGYSKQGEYAKAMEYYQRSLQINEEIVNKKGIASVLDHIGIMYNDQGEFAKAIEYFQKSLIVSEQLSDKRAVIGALNYIGINNNNLHDYSQAIIWCKKSLESATEINVLEEQRDACQCLYNAYKGLGNDKEALNYHERVSILNDSLLAAETEKKLQQIDFARQVLKDSLLREKEKLRIQLVNESEIKKKVQTRNIFLVVVFIMLTGAVSIYRRVHFARKAKKAIKKEKERSDNLLNNILPSKIADELKMKGKAEAKKFEEATILFSNFKGFLKISEKLSAEELVDEINSCFEPFDQICSKYGIEKIKTIGDSYMAAGGLPVPSGDAVKKTVLAGLEMLSFINTKKSEKKLDCQLCFEMRVGIHTGPVVAGIVGVSKFHYDIWGDSVNIASRMKDAGEVGKVNISQTTYELIKDDPEFKFEHRGKIQTKGKGEIEMWFVEKVL